VEEEEVAQRLLGEELVFKPFNTASERGDKITNERTSGLPGDETHNPCGLDFIIFIAVNGTT
jgi:hypothetical protein